MLRNWLNKASSIPLEERQRAAKIVAAVVVVVIGAVCMLQNSQPNYANLGPELLAESDERVLPPEAIAKYELARTAASRRMLPDAFAETVLEQLVVHVDKHGNIDVAGELINTDVFRKLLHTVKEDSTGDVSVLIHANKNCEVSTLQKVVDVCEECLTQYRLRIEENQTQSKPDKATLSGRA